MRNYQRSAFISDIYRREIIVSEFVYEDHPHAKETSWARCSVAGDRRMCRIVKYQSIKDKESIWIEHVSYDRNYFLDGTFWTTNEGFLGAENINEIGEMHSFWGIKSKVEWMFNAQLIAYSSDVDVAQT